MRFFRYRRKRRKKFGWRLFFKTFFIGMLTLSLATAFIIGIAIVDNTYRRAQNITPVNSVFFCLTDNALGIRAFGNSADIRFPDWFAPRRREPAPERENTGVSERAVARELILFEIRRMFARLTGRTVDS